MATATRTFGLQETLLSPEALPPPPLRHALLAFLVVLAAILHFGTAGWSDIHNGAEGEYAAGARRMQERPETRAAHAAAAAEEAPHA